MRAVNVRGLVDDHKGALGTPLSLVSILKIKLSTQLYVCSHSSIW